MTIYVFIQLNQTMSEYIRYGRGEDEPSVEYCVTMTEKVRIKIKCKGHNKVDWQIGNSSQGYERPVQEADNSEDEAVLESGSTCYHALVSSARQGRGGGNDPGMYEWLHSKAA